MKILFAISLNFVPKGPIDKAASVYVMNWCQTGDKPLPELMLTNNYMYYDISVSTGKSQSLRMSKCKPASTDENMKLFFSHAGKFHKIGLQQDCEGNYQWQINKANLRDLKAATGL